MIETRVLIAGDFHLLPHDEERNEHFARFMRMASKESRRLYLLGDLFDVWTGPKNLTLEGYEPVFNALRQAAKLGLKITWLPGNRDFNLDEKTAASMGLFAPGDTIREPLPSGTTLLTHGDLFLSADVAYQRLRRVLRSSTMRGISHRLPSRISAGIASKLRHHSRTAVAAKPQGQMRIVDTTVEAMMGQECVRAICGHVHRASVVQLPSQRELWTLGAFDEGGWYIVDEGEGLEQRRFRRSQPTT